MNTGVGLRRIRLSERDNSQRGWEEAVEGLLVKEGGGRLGERDSTKGGKRTMLSTR